MLESHALRVVLCASALEEGIEGKTVSGREKKKEKKKRKEKKKKKKKKGVIFAHPNQGALEIRGQRAVNPVTLRQRRTEG